MARGLLKSAPTQIYRSHLDEYAASVSPVFIDAISTMPLMLCGAVVSTAGSGSVLYAAYCPSLLTLRSRIGPSMRVRVRTHATLERSQMETRASPPPDAMTLLGGGAREGIDAGGHWIEIGYRCSNCVVFLVSKATGQPRTATRVWLTHSRPDHNICLC